MTSAQVLDAASIEQLYRAQFDRLQRFLMRRIKYEDDAEEVAQETFIRALRGVHNFRGESKPETWLFSIAQNVCCNRFKATRNDRLTDYIDEVQVQEQEDEDVMDVVARQRMLSDVDAVWQSMPDEMKRVMELVVVDGLDYEQAAAVIGAPVGTVKSRVFRAREKLKTGIEKVALTRKGAVEMGYFTKPICELIARNPQGLRAVEIADKVDCDTEMVEPAIREEIAQRLILVEEVIAPNQRAAKAYCPTDALIAKYPPAAKVEPAPVAKKSKAELGIEFIKNADFDVVDDDLRRVMGLTKQQYPSPWLAGAINSGVLHREGRFWRYGPAPERTQAQGIDVPVIRKSDGAVIELPAAVELPSPEVKPKVVTVEQPEPVAAPAQPVETKEVPEFLKKQEQPAAAPSTAPAANESGFMKVRLIEEPTFTLKLGALLIPGMRLVSEWNGMKELRDMHGNKVIVSTSEDMFANAFKGPIGSRPEEAVVIKASPDLIERLMRANSVEKVAA